MSKDVCVRAPASISTPTQKMLHVCVAIPTYRRPELLEALLGGIAKLAVPIACVVEVLVMDNNPTEAARALVAQVRERFPFELSYAHVQEPGLSSVRNFALGRARWGFDFLAMIDDDEIPQPQWLVELLRVQDETQADGVIGPVPQLVPADAPRWLRDGKFLELPVYADGAFVKHGYSGNCLLRVSSIERLGTGFDPALNFAGGEDLMFFRAWLRRGGKLAYAAHAVAEESVGADRLTAAYILRLNFRRGNTLSLCDRRLDGRVRTLTARALKASARIARGGASLVPLALLSGRTGAFRAFCDVANGLGGLVGLFGHTYQAYDRRNQTGEQRP